MEASFEVEPRPQRLDEPSPTGLTLRATLVGLLVGTLLCFTNMYFGLQTGWVTMGSIQCAVTGFLIFRLCLPASSKPFGPLENVVVQTVGVATATMPLAGGFVGIIPALEMLDPPVRLSGGQQLMWCAALTYFGVFCAVPLRRQTILVEQLRFPSGTATAKVIQVLHSQAGDVGGHWRSLSYSFTGSFCIALLGFFVPSAKNLHVFTWMGLPSLTAWHWTARPSLSYIGQGMIMGQRSAFSMLAGALCAWAVLGPLAQRMKWVQSVDIDSWECGVQGWLLWISIGLMLSESLSSLALTMISSCVQLTSPGSNMPLRAGSACSDSSSVEQHGSSTSSTSSTTPCNPPFRAESLHWPSSADGSLLAGTCTIGRKGQMLRGSQLEVHEESTRHSKLVR